MVERDCPEGECLCGECPGIYALAIEDYLRSIGFTEGRNGIWNSPGEQYGHQFTVRVDTLLYSSNLAGSWLALPAPFPTAKAAVYYLITNAVASANMQIQQAIKKRDHIQNLLTALTED